MDLHQNARLSLRSREDLAIRIMIEKVTWKAAAAAFHVSRKTSAPLIAPVIALRPQLPPPYPIAQTTGLSPATVRRIRQRAHLNRWRYLHPAPPVVRYEHPAPGDRLHLDSKGMTRYQRVSIRGDGRRRGRPQFPGWPVAA